MKLFGRHSLQCKCSVDILYCEAVRSTLFTVKLFGRHSLQCNCSVDILYCEAVWSTFFTVKLFGRHSLQCNCSLDILYSATVRTFFTVQLFRHSLQCSCSDILINGIGVDSWGGGTHKQSFPLEFLDLIQNSLIYVQYIC